MFGEDDILEMALGTEMGKTSVHPAYLFVEVTSYNHQVSFSLTEGHKLQQVLGMMGSHVFRIDGSSLEKHGMLLRDSGEVSCCFHRGVADLVGGNDGDDAMAHSPELGVNPAPHIVFPLRHYSTG